MGIGLKSACLLLQFILLCMVVGIGVMLILIMTILHVRPVFLTAIPQLCFALGALYIRFLVLVLVLLVAGLLLWVMVYIFVLHGRLMLPGIMKPMFVLPSLRPCALHSICRISQVLVYVCALRSGFATSLGVLKLASKQNKSCRRLRTIPIGYWISFALSFTSLPLHYSLGPV